MSLLSQAKKVTTTRRYAVLNEDQLELALGWLKKEINNTQVEKILYPGLEPRGGVRIYTFLTNAFRQAYAEGKLTIKK